MPNPSRYTALRCGVIFFLLALLFQVETLLIPARQDSAAWLYMGARQKHGEMPGRDLWDNKLPLIYLIGRAADASGHPRGFLWIVEAALTAVGGLAVFGIARGAVCMRETSPKKGDAAGRRAAVAGGMLCVVSGAPGFHAGGFMTEIYAMPLAAVGVWLSMRGLEKHANNGNRESEGERAGWDGCQSTASLRARLCSMRSWSCWVGAGIAWGLAVSFRLPLAVVAVLVVGYLAIVAGRDCLRAGGTRTESVEAGWRFLMGHLVGGMAAVCLVLAHPVGAGYLRECVAAAIAWPLGIGGWREAGPETLSTGERFAEFGQDVLRLGWLHGAAVIGLVFARREASRPLIGVVAIWYLASLGSAAIGWASYSHYQYVAFAPMCVAVAAAGGRFTTKLGRRVGVGFCFVTVAAIVAMNTRSLFRHWPERSHADVDAVVRFIHSNTAADESVLVWAWSGSTDLLYRIDRPGGTRHFLAHSYLNMDMRLLREFGPAFMAGPPAWIVEDLGFSGPSLAVTSSGFDSGPVAAMREVQAFARGHYRQRAVIGRFAVFRYVQAFEGAGGRS